MRGFFGIGVFHPKTELNIGTLWRHAMLFDASFVFTIGRRYRPQHSDTCKAPRHIPLFHYPTFDDFYENLPHAARLVCVELANGATALPAFEHPRQAVYLLGAEDHGIPASITEKHPVVTIPSVLPHSMNVASAGTLVMYDRHVKGGES